MPEHIAILGAGPAGIAAAQAASRGNVRVSLIGSELPGGRAGCLLPSKILLAAADCLATADGCKSLAVTGAGEHKLNLPALRAHAADLSRSWSQDQHRQLRSLGVDFIQGTASFLAPQRLQIEDPQGSKVEFSADTFILATGSVPIFPSGLEPDGARILAPRFISKLESLPESMIVIGGGVTGAETVSAFGRLGVQVRWIVDARGVLPTFPRPVGAALEEALTAQGIDIVRGVRATSAISLTDSIRVELDDGRSLVAQSAFIAVGRRPDIARLNLHAVSLPQDPRIGIAVDRQCRSLVGRIYAAGDVTGAPMTANKAIAQGWTAGLHASGITSACFRPNQQIEAVYTHPQVAKVGLQQTAAREAGFSAEEVRIELQQSLKSRILEETQVFISLVVEPQQGRILGASAFGSHASDLLAPVAVALKLDGRISDLEEIFLAHSTLGELVPLAARSYSSLL